jgi:serine/threonine-protein kinase
MDKPLDLLFGMLALRADLIDDKAFAETLVDWSVNKTLPMSEILQERGLIDEGAKTQIDTLLAQKLAEHGGDPWATLAGVTYADHVKTLLASLDSHEREAMVSFLPPASTTAAHVLLESMGQATASEPERYARTRLHARGGIGQVWLARDGDLGRDVALKELRPERVNNPDAWARFLEEARITGQLEHPGIVPVYELKRRGSDQQSYYTMRFIRGRTLSEAIHDYHDKRQAGHAGPLDFNWLLNRFVGVCNAVAYAHSRRVVHRDLKGQNIILGDYGEAIVLDWGLAKVIGAQPAEATRADANGTARTETFFDLGSAETLHDSTQQGQVLGTPAYMAPEQAEGRLGAIDERTDVYGLGAILYEILTDQAPFSGPNTLLLLRRVREEAPKPPRQVNAEAPKALEAICLKALAKQPDDRYQTVAELANDVERWLADEPVSAYHEPWTARTWRWARRHRTAVASSIVFLASSVLALAVGTVLVGRERDEARAQRQQARQAVDDMYTQVAEQWLEDRLDPLQKKFLGQALGYYENFTKADSSEAIVRQERGRAYQRMGDVLRKLGRHQEAEAAYRRAIEVLGSLTKDRPNAPEHRYHLGQAHAHLAATLSSNGRDREAQEQNREALELLDQVDREVPETAHHLALAKALRSSGEMHRKNARPALAEPAYRRAIKLLEPMAKGHDADVESRLELAVALDGLGLLLHDESRTKEAASSYQNAIALLEPLVAEAPNLPRPKDALSRSYNSVGLLGRELGSRHHAEATLRKEVALDERLTEDFPDRPDYRRALARGQLNLGILLKERGQTKEAEAAYRRALDLNEKLASDFPTVTDYRRDQGRALANLGELSAAAARQAEAEEFDRKAIAVYEKLAAENPAVPDYRAAWAGSLVNLGALLRATSRLPEAEQANETAFALFERVVSEQPDHPDYRRGMAKCSGNMGTVLSALGRRQDAEMAYERAQIILEKLLSDGGNRVEDQQALSLCLSNRGENLREAGRPGALEVLERAVALSSKLAKEFPTVPSHRRNAAVSQINLGELLAESGKPKEAEVAYATGLAQLEALAGEFPKIADYQGHLGYVLGDMGLLSLKNGRRDQARSFFEQAIAHERAALAINPRSTTVRAQLGQHLESFAGVLIDQGAHAEAVRAGDDLLKLSADLSGARGRVARILARSVPLALADAKLPESRRTALSALYADRAIALLREAVEKGEPGALRLQDDATFEPLHSRDGFKTLLIVLADRSEKGVD